MSVSTTLPAPRPTNPGRPTVNGLQAAVPTQPQRVARVSAGGGRLTAPGLRSVRCAEREPGFAIQQEYAWAAHAWALGVPACSCAALCFSELHDCGRWESKLTPWCGKRSGFPHGCLLFPGCPSWSPVLTSGEKNSPLTPTSHHSAIYQGARWAKPIYNLAQTLVWGAR
jgi:hypothetical protein